MKCVEVLIRVSRPPRWIPDATTNLQHPNPVLEPQGERPAPGRPVSLFPTTQTFVMTSDRAYSTTRHTTSHLSELAQEFIKLPFGDFGACQKFIVGHPEIRREYLDNFKREAVRLLRDGNTSQLRNCVEKQLLLWYIEKMSDRDCRVFFDKLAMKDPTTSISFYRDL